MHLVLFLIELGVQILERTSVQQVLVEKGQVTAVETDRGSIECEYFVNCAGQVKLPPGSQECHSYLSGFRLVTLFI